MVPPTAAEGCVTFKPCRLGEHQGYTNEPWYGMACRYRGRIRHRLFVKAVPCGLDAPKPRFWATHRALRHLGAGRERGQVTRLIAMPG